MLQLKKCIRFLFRKNKTFHEIVEFGHFLNGDILILVVKPGPHIKSKIKKKSLQVCSANFRRYQWLHDMFHTMARCNINEYRDNREQIFLKSYKFIKYEITICIYLYCKISDFLNSGGSLDVF